MNKIKFKYEQLIEAGLFTEQQLIYFRKYINGSTKLERLEASELAQAFIYKAETDGIELTQSQQTKGYLWLKSKTFKLNGGIRKNSPLAYFEQHVINHFDSFKCVGLYDLSENSYRHYVPIYRCMASDGQWFDYVCKMWGEIEVIAIGNGPHGTSSKNQPEWQLARQGKQSERVTQPTPLRTKSHLTLVWNKDKEVA